MLYYPKNSNFQENLYICDLYSKYVNTDRLVDLKNMRMTEVCFLIFFFYMKQCFSFM